MNRLRVVFMGTPDFVVPVLDALIASHHDVIAVYSQPPRPSGRGYALQKSPVHLRADEAGIPVFTPKSLKGEAEQKEFAALNADVAVVAGYGMLLPKIVLDTPRYGCINVHVSLLPRWRGASPVQYAIWKGDKETGVTIMKMDVGMDSGDIIAQKSMPITDTSTAAQMYVDLFTLGAGMLPGILDTITSIKATPQDSAQATYAPMFKKTDGKIDWSDRAVNIIRQINALNPWPGTYTIAQGKRLKILSASLITGSAPAGTVLDRKGQIACGWYALQLHKVQPEGGKVMDGASAVSGKYINVGDVLT